MEMPEGWVPTRSRGSLGTWRSDGPVRYWYSAGELYRTVGDDLWGPLEAWRDGAWTVLDGVPTYALAELDAVPVTAEDAEAFIRRERSSSA